MVTLNHAYTTPSSKPMMTCQWRASFFMPLMYTLNARKTSVYQSLAARFINQ